MNAPFNRPRTVSASTGPVSSNATTEAAEISGGNLDDDDPGMPSMEERRAQSARNMAMIAALPPRQVDEEAARKRADDAVRSLLPGLLTDTEIVALSVDQRRFNRCKSR